MSTKYLDENGLKIVWSKTKAKIAEVDTKVGAIEALPEDKINAILADAPAAISFVLNKYNEDGALTETNEFQFEEGMTWAEFCDSEYNTYLSEDAGIRHFIYNELFVMHGAYDASVAYNNVDVKPTDVIISSAEYSMYL